MSFAEIAIIISTKSQGRTFVTLCKKYNIKYVSINYEEQRKFPIYMMLLKTANGTVAVPNSSRKGEYGVETCYGCSVYTLDEFKDMNEYNGDSMGDE
mgnify:CR=1 FL=1